LRWLGIVPDEGPTEGGPLGPYKQSERLAIYRQYIQLLLDAGDAYYAFDTPEEIEEMRQRLKGAKVASPQYNGISRTWMRNGLTMPVDQVKEWIEAGKPYVIRLKIAYKSWVRFYDLVRGWVKVDSSVLDDKVLMKSDGLPTYHFASVVDDYLMKITHVIRGEEWLPSTPIHLLLYRYLGWAERMPQFVHLPLLLAPDGSGKLSKRHADKYGFPAFPIAWKSADLIVERGFREEGYLPEALWNFLALLGWRPGTNQELFTKQGLIEAFSLERLGKSGAKFDIAKANWFNQQHIKQQGPTVWANYVIREAAKENMDCNEQDAKAICMLVKDRITFPKDFWLEGRFFFFDPIDYNSDLLQKKVE
jgi:glutamyl-tRNA synthetase